MPTKLFAASLALLAPRVPAHICLFGPATQRGGLPADPLTPGTRSCFKSAGPCGGMPAEEPNASLPGGTALPLRMQQNLNHFSVGSPGILEWAVSLTADPQSDDQFEVLGTINDYDAYHEWTQTNVTLNVILPNVDCPHAVLRVRYISNKPTEPVFHQCADISIISTTGTQEAEPPARRESTRPLSASASVASLIALGVGEVYALADSFSTAEPAAILGAVNVASGVMTRVVAEFEGHPVDANSPAYTADVVAAVDAAQGVIYYLQNNQTVGDSSATTFAFTIVAVEVATGVEESTPFESPFPLSGLHFNSASGQLLGVGLQLFNGTDHSYGVVALDFENRGVSLLSSSAALGPFVDYAWSQLDSSSGLLYILSRHEDEPTTLEAVIVTVDLSTGASTSVDTDPAFIFASFVVDKRGGGRGNLLAMSPGSVDANGDADPPAWQLVRVDATTGAVASEALAPAAANVGPAHWGGGVWGYPGVGSFLFFAATVEQKTGQTDYKNVPSESVALEVIPGTSDEATRIEVINAHSPWWHNIVVVSNKQA